MEFGFNLSLWIKILNKPLLQDNSLLSSGKCMNGIWYFLNYSKSNSSYLKGNDYFRSKK